MFGAGSREPAPCIVQAMRTALVTLLASLFLALSPATAGAATRSVSMDNSRTFHPAVITIARGDTVRWSVGSSAATSHDVKSDGPLSYFASPGGVGGIHPGHS